MAKYCEKLTRDMLRNWGFTQAVYKPDLNMKCDGPKDLWYIEREWRKNNSKSLARKRISVTEAVCKHKYTADKTYLKLTFMTPEGPKSITLSRFIYVWFIGDLEAGEVVDHIDNNPYNNHPNNLQKLSVGENLAKRFIDNANNAKNQYTTKLYKNQQKHPELYEMVHEMYEAGKTYEEALAKIYKCLQEEGIEEATKLN